MGFMADRFDHEQRPFWQAQQDEQRRATSRDFEQRQREFDQRKLEQQEREAFIRAEYGAELAKKIELASKIVDVHDEHIKATALDALVENIAKREVQPSQISTQDFYALCYESIARAEGVLQQVQQGVEQHQPEPPRDSHHYYATLNETHRDVGAALEAQEATLGNDADRSEFYRRYTPLEETHREVAEASKPLNRSERETREAEAQLTSGEMTDAAQSRAKMLRALRQDFAREHENEHDAGYGAGRDLGMSD
jgi:hypothetical protein